MKDLKKHLRKVEDRLENCKRKMHDTSLSDGERIEAKNLHDYYYEVWLEIPLFIEPSRTEEKKYRGRRGYV